MAAVSLGMRLLAVVVATPALVACSTADGCMGGDDGSCLPVSACGDLVIACEGDTVRVSRLARAERTASAKVAGAAGDVALSNGVVRAVFDALSAPHALAPSGGSLIDLELADGSAPDALNLVYQAVGILPDDAVRYHSLDVVDDGATSASLVYRGTLDGRPDFDVVTRYELRACEPGLRIRTEFHRAGRDALAVFPADALFWGDRGLLPFVPGRGLGLRHPELDLAELGEALVEAPFLTAAAPGTADASYALVPCGASLAESFQSATLSAIGAPLAILMPGDSIAFERFVGVAAGPGHGAAVTLARELRASLYGESAVELAGRVMDELGRPLSGAEERVAVLVYEPAPGSDPDAASERLVVAEVAPDADGRFSVLVPPGPSYRLEVSLFGRALASHWQVDSSAAELVLDDLVVPASAELAAVVRDAGADPLIAELVLVPVNEADALLYSGSIFGEFAEGHCSPFLGPPHGASPACNRVLVGPSGEVRFAVPPGDYYVYATRGPFWSLARQEVSLEPGADTALVFELEPLPLLPTDALSADLHVHGKASFDSSLPDRDRALSFVAANVDVIAATDHDVVSDYRSALAALGISDRVRVMPGVETTGQILFYQAPGEAIPKVVGHFNFWPLRLDVNAPRRGAPDDELVEPGGLYDRVAPLFDGEGVAQLNHPFAESKLGRDEGYFTAAGWDPRRPLPSAPDGSSEGELVRRGPGGLRNIDYDVQEVMNGASVEQFLAYRAGWFSLLNQGILRAGTANSDSHTLAVEQLGYPRTIVLEQGPLVEFERERFNAAVREGRSFGTNGPVLFVCVGVDGEDCRRPSLTAFTPAAESALHLSVVAAPWIPVSELRVFVNGALARSIAVDRAADPFGAELPSAFEAEIPLSELAPAGADFWVVVEGGLPLPEHAVGEDGLPLISAGASSAPLSADDPRFHLNVIAPKTLPLAFTNPLLIDRSGDGWTAPGLP